MNTTTKAAAGTTVTLAAALATALLLGGEHTKAPAPIRTPAIGIIQPKYLSQTLSWDKSTDATGYRLYLNGLVIGLVPGGQLAALVSVPCGVQQRFNVQPFNNKGFATLAPPLYFTSPCP